ncbi:ribosomal subunit interface protein, partial [Streptomyces hainanensis]
MDTSHGHRAPAGEPAPGNALRRPAADACASRRSADRARRRRRYRPVRAAPAPGPAQPPVRRIGSVVVEGDGPLVVREKTHLAAPMSLDQA